MRWSTLLVMPVFAIGIAGCSTEGDSSSNLGGEIVHIEHLNKSQFHGKWPANADAGTIACHVTEGKSLTFKPDGGSDVYALNGTAMDWASKEGWKNFREIWLTDVDPGPNVDTSDFFDEGFKVCDGHGTYGGN